MKFLKPFFLFLAVFTASTVFAQNFTERSLRTQDVNRLELEHKVKLTKLKAFANSKGLKVGAVVEATKIENREVKVEGSTRQVGEKGFISHFHFTDKTTQKTLSNFFLEIEGATYVFDERDQVVLSRRSWFTDLIDCFKDNASTIGENCGNCINCMKGCEGKWGKWRRYWCMIKCGFSSPCVKCATSFWSLLVCIWAIIK